MFQKITWDLLEAISPSMVLVRGEDYYYSGAVLKVTYNKQKDLITAVVRGSQHYAVTIRDVSAAPRFNCTCPYDMANVCKHGVAAALKIIEEPDSVKIEKTKDVPDEPAVRLETLFKKASVQQKEHFLMDILEENDFYRDKFRTLVLGQIDMESKTTVNEIRDKVKEDIEDFDLVNYERFYDTYNPRSGWRDEWEILYDGARDELNEITERYEDSIRAHLDSGNIVDASKELLGLYEGISLVDEDKIDDEMEIVPDGIGGELMGDFGYFMKEFVERFRVVDKDDNAVQRISQIIVERVRYYRQNASRYNGFEYELLSFKPFLKELVCGTETAKYWDSALEQLDLKDNSTDEVQLKIAEVLKDKVTWLRAAEKNFRANPIVTQSLLDFYQHQGDTKNFIRVGKHALTTWADKFDSYLYENLEKEQDPDFFDDVVFHYAKREKSIPLFDEYKKLFGQTAANAFIEKIKKEWDCKLYYINLLEEEKNYPAILQYVKENVTDWDFKEIIKPILDVYPAECFKIIRGKTDKYLDNNVGRKYYVHAAQWLKLLLKIKDKEIGEKAQRYFNSLFSTYNRRPALKEELRKAGIQHH